MSQQLRVIGRTVAAVFLFWSSAAQLPVSAATYYVATGGDNGDSGDQDHPWRDIQHAADTMVAGDTVYVRTGVYQERVVPQNSGNASNYITYAAFPGDLVTIDGDGVFLPPGWGGLFEISSRSYLRVSGLRIANVGPDDNHAGLLVEDSSHVILENNTTYNTTSSGIGVWSSDHVTIDGNEVELACNDGEQECITISGTDIFEVRNNHVHHGGPGTIGGEGIDVKDGSSNGRIFNNRVDSLQRLGIYVDAWENHTFNIEIYRNAVTDCAEGGFAVASEAGGLLEDVRIYNNIAYGNGLVGLTVAGWGEPVPSHPITDVIVINNTFYDNGGDAWGGGISIENPDAANLVFRNNIVSQNSSFQILVDSGVPMPVVDHNLIDGFRDYEGEIRGSNHQEGDPRFMGPLAGDFHLLPDSPAIDNGSPVAAPDDDFDGAPRPQGGGFDIGGFEHGAAIFADGFESGDLSAWG